MILLTTERVLLLHQIMIRATGGIDGVRDMGLVESAVNNPQATFCGEELYPTKEEKAAVLCYSLISNHAFLDGNKRIGIYAMLTFLDVNGIDLDYEDREAVELGLGVASGRFSKEAVLEWIASHEICI